MALGFLVAVSRKIIDMYEDSICATIQLAFSAVEEYSGRRNCNVSNTQHFFFSPCNEWINCSCFSYLLWHTIFLRFFPLFIWSQSQLEEYLGYLTSVINSWSRFYVCIYLVPRTISHIAGLCCAAFYTNTEYKDHPQFS